MKFERAVDEYLDDEERPRPWTRKHEEESLRGLAGWRGLGEDSLEAVTAEVLAHYAQDRHLTPEETDDLNGTVASVRVWSRRRRRAGE